MVDSKTKKGYGFRPVGTDQDEMQDGLVQIRTRCRTDWFYLIKDETTLAGTWLLLRKLPL